MSSLPRLSTREAAKFCSVQPDTVLKWIKRGKLRATRTAGGHHRVDYQDLKDFLAERCGESGPCRKNATARPLRCWEFFSDLGILREGCKQCAVYRVRAALCFEMLKMGTGAALGHLFCQRSCEDCAYYRRVNGLQMHVLVITQDQDLINNLGGAETPGLTLMFVPNGYEASAAIGDFRPAFVIIDRDMYPDGGQEIVGCLKFDARVPGLRIIMATSSVRGRRHKRPQTSAFAVLLKPFGLDRLAALVKEQPVESVEDDRSGPTLRS